MTLTPKHERFCQEYLLDLNGSAAYRRAYPNVKNERVARTNAARLLANASVAARVAELQAARADRTQLSQDWVVERLRHEATLADGSHAARVSALHLLGKHLGMFVERVKVEAEDSGPPPEFWVRLFADDATRELLARLPALADGPAPEPDRPPEPPAGSAP